MRDPIGTIASQTASLTVVVFDAASAADWVPTRPAANKAQFTGHPAEVMRGLGKGEEVAAVDVGASSGHAFELEGRSGRIDAYRDGESLILVAPPRAWWAEHQADHLAEIDALLAQLLATRDDTETGHLELRSGKLAIVYLWLETVGEARDLTVPSGGAVGFGEGSGLVVDLGPGHYRLARAELDTPTDQPLVAMAFTRE